jgi:hypothetical protein
MYTSIEFGGGINVNNKNKLPSKEEVVPYFKVGF